MADIDTDLHKDIREYEKTLKQLYKYAVPNATRSALNTTAFDARKIAQRNLPQQFTLRNTYTKGGILYESTRERDINKMVTKMGSANDYMLKQEEGFTESSPMGVPVPTPETAGQKGRTRTKPRRQTMLMQSITTVKSGRKFNSRRATRIAKIREAMKLPASQRYIYDEFAGVRGYWKLVGGRRRKRDSGWPDGMRPVLIYSATRQTTRTKPTPWMDKASSEAYSGFGDRYLNQLKYQLKKQLNRK